MHPRYFQADNSMYTQTHTCKGTARNWLRSHKSLVMQSITRIFAPQVCMTSLCQCTTSVVLLKWQQINASKKVACLEKKNICYLYSERLIMRFFGDTQTQDLVLSFIIQEKKCFFVFVLLFYCTSNSVVSVLSYTPNKPTQNKDLKHRVQMFPEGTDDLFTFTYKTKHKQTHQHTTAEVFEHFYYDEWLKITISVRSLVRNFSALVQMLLQNWLFQQRNNWTRALREHNSPKVRGLY